MVQVAAAATAEARNWRRGIFGFVSVEVVVVIGGHLGFVRFGPRGRSHPLIPLGPGFEFDRLSLSARAHGFNSFPMRRRTFSRHDRRRLSYFWSQKILETAGART
jgi:hypothetical protein